MKRVLIGGGTGFVGRNVCKLLEQNGYQVTVVSRNPKDKQISWKDVEKHGLQDDYVAVVNLAGENILNKTRRFSDKRYVEDIWNSRVNTTHTLAKAIRDSKTPPQTFLTMSGVGFYPPSQKAVYTESSPGGNDWLARLARDWEAAGVLPEKCPTKRVILRSGTILGADGGFIKEEPLQRFVPGSGRQYFPWIHVEDISAIIQFCIERRHITGVINCAVPPAVTYREYMKKFLVYKSATLGIESTIIDKKLIDEKVLRTEEKLVKSWWEAIEKKDSLATSFRLFKLEMYEAFKLSTHLYMDVRKVIREGRSEEVLKYKPDYMWINFYGPERVKMLEESRNIGPGRLVRFGYQYLYPDLDAALKDISSQIETAIRKKHKWLLKK